MSRPRILIPIRHYEPAFRHGGAIRSVTNLVAALHNEFEFKIICLGRDFGETNRLDGIEEDVWLSRNGAPVRYLKTGLWHPFKLIKTIWSTEYDVVYLNSFFEPVFSTLPALLMRALVERCPVPLHSPGEPVENGLCKSFTGDSAMRAQTWTRSRDRGPGHTDAQRCVPSIHTPFASLLVSSRR